MAGRRTGTRERIKKVALELFIEQGYEKTSLREIAERLGVTKAALYYHFPTKQGIIEAVVADIGTDVDELVAWGQDQPRGPGTRAEILRRIAELVTGPWGDVIRFGQTNQAAMRSHDVGEELGSKMFAVVGLIIDPDAGLEDQLRSLLALVAIYLANLPGLPDVLGPLATASPEERSAAATAVARDLIGLADPASTLRG